MIVYAILLYNFCIVAGTAYLIALHDWSMWTWVITFLFFITGNLKDKQ